MLHFSHSRLCIKASKAIDRKLLIHFRSDIVANPKIKRQQKTTISIGGPTNGRSKNGSGGRGGGWYGWEEREAGLARSRVAASSVDGGPGALDELAAPLGRARGNGATMKWALRVLLELTATLFGGVFLGCWTRTMENEYNMGLFVQKHFFKLSNLFWLWVFK
jgi:hypothetical protein